MSTKMDASEPSPHVPDIRAREFLSAVNGIEQILRKRYNIDIRKAHGLDGVLRISEQSGDWLVKRYTHSLAAFRDLRNAIAHSEYKNGLPIANPLPETVLAAKRLFELFAEPPRLHNLNLKPPYTVKSTDPLQGCLKYMFECEYAQAPVYRETSTGLMFEGLLTTNAVARWVASSIEDDGTLLIDSASVADVLPTAEEHEVALCWPKTRTVVDAIDQLLRPNAPIALIVTHSGKWSEKPLGMLVAADLPEMLEETRLSGAYS